jgi:hypothetical protein
MDIFSHTDTTTAVPNTVVAAFVNKTQCNVTLTDTDTMSGLFANTYGWGHFKHLLFYTRDFAIIISFIICMIYSFFYT